MDCYSDKFVITKGQDNEFVFTIKKNGSTEPIEIATNSYTTTIDSTPGVVYHEAVEYVAAVEEVLAVEEVEAVIGIDEKLAKYYISSPSIPYIDSENTNTYYYVLYLNDATYTYEHTNANTYSYVVNLLQAFAAAITNGSANGITVDSGTLPSNINAYVNNNKLYIEATENFTVNTITLTNFWVSDYIAPVEAVDYVAPVEYVAPVAEVPAVPAYYTATNEDVTVDFSNLLPSSLEISSIVVTPDSAIAAVANSIVSGDGYDIGTATSFTYTPVTNEDDLEEPLDAITFTISFNLNSGDSFIGVLRELSTQTNTLALPFGVAEGVTGISVENALSGQIKLFITSADTLLLDQLRGSQVDRYYLRPTYELVLDCSTVENGDFLAKVCNIYIG